MKIDSKSVCYQRCIKNKFNQNKYVCVVCVSCIATSDDFYIVIVVDKLDSITMLRSDAVKFVSISPSPAIDFAVKFEMEN